MVRRIILYRHGERSDIAPEERKIPHSIPYDPPLTSLGHLQAEAAGSFLHSELASSPSIRLLSSPMLRCVQTISYLAQRLNKPVHLQNAFGEAFEKDQGEVYNLLFTRHRKEEFPVSVDLIEENEYLRPANQENLEQAGKRMEQVMKGYFEGVEEEVLVICTHLYVIWGMNATNGDVFDKNNFTYTQVTEYEYSDGLFRMVRSGVHDFLQGVGC